MGSSRFPGKPLALIAGKPMIEHVVRRVGLSDAVKRVVVATCDIEICAAVTAFGGEAVMTSPRHERASDRVAEVAEHLDAEVVVMVQGDEPMTRPEMITQALRAFADPTVECVNLIARIEDEQDFHDPNTVKVVRACDGRALYFSRSPIPAGSIAGTTLWKQVCVIPFRRETLLGFASLPPSPLERAESIDMLRLLEHGHTVQLVETTCRSWAVDTPADIARVEQLFAADDLISRYSA
jgi:3-deoxy-manno-octulosonate cytidylyltransferase (CMP-KDO synthetase)